tara:strand:- start:3042 stop:3551 length:510 start_codon:yes stop_codon:yes gene_type:complete
MSVLDIFSRTALIILLLLGIFFLSRNKSESCEYLCIPRSMIPTSNYYDNLGNYTQGNSEKRKALMKEWKKEYKFHEDNGNRCYADAKSRAWYIPTISDRDKAKNCFVSAISSLGASTPSSRLLCMILSTFTQISLACIDEYNYIEMKLNWAQYHFDMCDHYSNLIRNNE